jgi:hypothetical protein
MTDSFSPGRFAPGGDKRVGTMPHASKRIGDERQKSNDRDADTGKRRHQTGSSHCPRMKCLKNRQEGCDWPRLVPALTSSHLLSKGRAFIHDIRATECCAYPSPGDAPQCLIRP